MSEITDELRALAVDLASFRHYPPCRNDLECECGGGCGTLVTRRVGWVALGGGDRGTFAVTLCGPCKLAVAPLLEARYVAAWSERDMPNGDAGGRFGPLSLRGARRALAEEIRRNLWRWSHGEPGPYERALAEVESASGPLSIRLPYHVVSLTLTAR